MKTKNRVQKLIAGSLVVIFSLVLVSITVNAQKYWEVELIENENPIALATFEDLKVNSELASFDKTSKNTKAEVLLEVEIEKALELENWMVDEKVFDLQFIAIDVEEPLELEDWMKNEKYFTNSTVDFLAENKECLKIESWMMDKKIWE